MPRTFISRGPVERGARSLSSRSFIILGVTCSLLGFRFLLLVPWVRLAIGPAGVWKKCLRCAPPDSRKCASSSACGRGSGLRLVLDVGDSNESDTDVRS